MLTIDGSYGEGGGQILRTSLALSIVTGTPFVIERIRAGRKRPGLQNQHLASVRAAARVGCAQVEGDAIDSQRLVFRPGAIAAGHHEFDIGTAGSASLVLQTVLPPLLVAKEPSTLVIEGGTHNPLAPPFDFLERAFLPLVCRLGPHVTMTLDRPGFFPKGGGRIRVKIEPSGRLDRLDLLERGEIKSKRVRALVAQLPVTIGERECRTIAAASGWEAVEARVEELRNSRGPGNVVLMELESEHVTEVFSACGERGVRAEDVARKALCEAQGYLEANVPVGKHLADQLLVPLALGAHLHRAGGTYRTLPLSEHSRTNIDVIRKFLAVKIDVAEAAEGVVASVTK